MPPPLILLFVVQISLNRTQGWSLASASLVFLVGISHSAPLCFVVVFSGRELSWFPGLLLEEQGRTGLWSGLPLLASTWLFSCCLFFAPSLQGLELVV